MEADARLRPVNRLRVCLGAATVTAVVIAGASAMAATPIAPRLPDRDCRDFVTQAEAQQFFESHNPQQDPHTLDADNDGVACEILPEGGGVGGFDDAIFHRGHVVGASDSRFHFYVHRSELKPLSVQVVSFHNVPTSCVNGDTGEVRSGSLAVAYLPDRRLIDKRLRISRSGRDVVIWRGPDGVDSPATVYEVAGRFTRRGTRGSGKLSASAIVNGVWDCTTGQVRWRTRYVRFPR